MLAVDGVEGRGGERDGKEEGCDLTFMIEGAVWFMMTWRATDSSLCSLVLVFVINVT